MQFKTEKVRKRKKAGERKLETEEGSYMSLRMSGKGKEFSDEEDMKKKEEFELIKNSNPLKDDENILQQSMINLFECKILSIEEKAQIIEILHQSFGRNILTEILMNIDKEIYIQEFESFKIIAELINYLLTGNLLPKLILYYYCSLCH